MIGLYARLLTPIDVGFSVLGLFIIIITIFLLKQKSEHERLEDAMFLKVCLSAAVFALFTIVRFVFILFTASLINTGLISVSYYVMDMAYLFYALMWLIFVDATMYHSADGIRRRYSLALIPFVLLFIHILSVFIIQSTMSRNFLEFTKTGAYKYTIISGDIAVFISVVLGAYYMIRAFMIAYCYQNEVKQPVFLRLDVFIIPWCLGFICLLTAVIPGLLHVPFRRLPDISALCAALSVFLTFCSMMNRFRYMDPDTGFYRQDFISFLPDYLKQRDYPINCVINITPLEKREEIAGMLKELKPDRSTVIESGDGGFLLLSDVDKPMAAKLFVRTLGDASIEKLGTESLKHSTLFRNENETVTDFLNRAIK